MPIKNYSTGFAYVLSNEAMPGVVKIGFTSLLPEDRAKKLHTTGVPLPFDVEFQSMTSNFKEVESSVHESLAAQRTSRNREFFRVSPEEAQAEIRLCALECAGIDAWESNNPIILRAGDRIVLWLLRDQAFLVLSYPDEASLLSRSPDIIDIWKAQSDGDTFELYVVDSAGSAASFGEGHEEGVTDPLPFLDRKRRYANGLINGRERLFPGERLVWIPAPDDPARTEGPIFEAACGCQIVGRTWSPQFNADGWPLTLNAFDQSELWPAARDSIRRAFSLDVPREWSPRILGGDESLYPSEVPTDPAFWLPQLSLREKKIKF